MTLLRPRYRAWIVPYAEGILDARRCAALEARLARDPILAAEAEAERRVVLRLRAAAQDAESADEGTNLWPGIQSRLEPRRRPVRPLILAGGLSAAATSLAWAALWGPLHRPAPLPARVGSAGMPPVIVVAASPGHPQGRLNRRSRHGDAIPVRHRPTLLPRPKYGITTVRPGMTDLGRVAENSTPSLGEGGGNTAAPPAAGATARFHLATSVRPIGQGEEGRQAPPEGIDVPAPDDATASPMQTSVSETPRARRPRRRLDRAEKSLAGADTPADAAGAGPTLPAGHTPARPPNAPKPID